MSNVAISNRNTGTFFVVEGLPTLGGSVAVTEIAQFSYEDRSADDQLSVGDTVDGKEVIGITNVIANNGSASISMNDGSTLSTDVTSGNVFVMSFVELSDDTKLATLGGARDSDGGYYFSQITSAVVANGSGVSGFTFANTAFIQSSGTAVLTSSLANMFDMSAAVFAQPVQPVEPEPETPRHADGDPNTGAFFVVDGAATKGGSVDVTGIGQYTYENNGRLDRLDVGDIIDGKAVVGLQNVVATRGSASVNMNDGTALSSDVNKYNVFVMSFIELSDGTQLATLGGAQDGSGDYYFSQITDDVIANGSGVASFDFGARAIIRDSNFASLGSNVANMFDMGDAIFPEIASPIVAAETIARNDDTISTREGNLMGPEDNIFFANLDFFESAFASFSAASYWQKASYNIFGDFIGTKADEVLEDTRGNSWVFGFDGNDVIRGLDGNDNLAGGSGNDILEGGDGQDLLDGGDGNDVLIGGADIDVFVFRKGDGVTDIVDFELSYDILDIEGFNGQLTYDVLTAAGRQVGDDVFYDVGDDTLILRDVVLATMIEVDLCAK